MTRGLHHELGKIQRINLHTNAVHQRSNCLDRRYRLDCVLVKDLSDVSLECLKANHEAQLVIMPKLQTRITLDGVLEPLNRPFTIVERELTKRSGFTLTNGILYVTKNV